MSDAPTASKPYLPHASLVMRGKELDPEMINERLGVRAHRSFKRGDKRQRGHGEWPHGFWILESSGQVNSVDLVDHIRWLLEEIKPFQESLVRLLADGAIDVKISCFWILPSSNELFILEPELLAQIALLNIKFELDIYSPN
jgi:hypothetical protein